MNALINAHTHRGRNRSSYAGLTSNVLPEAQRSQTGVSSDYAQKANHEWFVLRITYNRIQKAHGIISASDIQSYMPMHYAIKNEIGKKKRILQPLLPNLLFVYATREAVNSIIKNKGAETSILKFYLDKTKPLEENGKHPPLTIPFAAMTNFIKATSTNNDHVRIVTLFNIGVQSLYSQNIDLNHYHRSSLYSVLLKHPEQQFSKEIVTTFLKIPIPDKYNNHNLRITIMNAPILKKMTKEELEGSYKDAICNMLNRNKIGGRIIEKWFNRDKYTGAFDMNLVKERGFYDATILDVQQALQSARGLAQIEDAGEELISHSYVLVNDIRYVDATLKRNLQGLGVLLGMMGSAAFVPIAGGALALTIGETGVAINDLVVGFKVYVTSYLFRLDWNENVANDFYSNLWYDKANVEMSRKQLFDNQMGNYKLTYVGCTTVYSGETSLAGVKNESDMFLKVCTRSIDKAISELQKSFDEFKVFTPLVSTSPLCAYIGLKEGVSEDSRFEVLEKTLDPDGRTKYERVGIVKPLKGKIWDNRFMASFDKEEGFDLEYTTFEKISGRDFFPGMLIREIK